MDPLVVRFAQLMHSRHGAELYVFGSRGRGTAGSESDYDLVAVSPTFAGQRGFLRAPDRYELWQEAGGYALSLDLHCYTPEEFREELESAGYLGDAHERGELVKVQPCDDGPRQATGY